VERARGEAKPNVLRPSERKEAPAWVKPALAVASVGALVAALWVAGPSLLPYSDHALRQGLVAVAEAARKDIEDYRRAKGALPALLPNMALAMVVEYTREGDDYRLRATDGVRVVDIDAKGTVTTSP
jgi:hypothetical protein